MASKQGTATFYLKDKNPELVRALHRLCDKRKTPSCGQFKATWVVVDSHGVSWALKRKATYRELCKWKGDDSADSHFDRSADDVLSEVMAQEFGAVNTDAIVPYVAWCVIGKHFWAVQPAVDVLDYDDECTEDLRAACDELNEMGSFNDAYANYRSEQQWNPDTQQWEEVDSYCWSDLHNVGVTKEGKVRLFDWGYHMTRMSVDRKQGFLTKVVARA